jgi:hypothetical protein
MGLDFSRCKAHWGYSGFHYFRVKLASEIGINLDEMAHFAEDGKSWENIEDDIKPLLIHSDCDGDMKPEICAKVAPRLRQLIKDWDDCYDKQQAMELARGMDKCAKAKKPLVFI